IRSEDIDSTLDLSSKTVTLPAASVTSHVTQTDTTPLEDDIAILGFKVAANGSLSKYNLADQTIDSYEDATGIDTSASTNEVRESSGNYYTGTLAGPAIDSYVETLLHGDGSDSGTTFTDSSSNSFSPSVNGNTVTSTSSPKFGTASISVPSISSDSIYWGAGSTNLHLDAKDWTVSFWIKTTSTTEGKLFGRNNGSAGQHNFDLAITCKSDGTLCVTTNTDTEYNNAGRTTTAINDGDWHHIEFTRSGSNVRGFTDGTLEGTTDVSSSAVINRESSAFYMGNTNGGHYYGVVCNVDEFEFSIGIARHTASFTPPTAAWGAATYVDMTLISNATTAEAVPTKGDLVMTYSDGAGTTSIGDGTNGDIRAFISRDDGTTYTQATLASQGTTGGHTILTAHDLDISSQPSGTSMRYKITTHNQSASLETRIQAVSLGWS
ncbi:MAG: LamG domain-containing protein, partial [Gammaproteobacteria bacterium]|nr:LamG domain-containing protein [Gammaproteobacteria bacterium]